MLALRCLDKMASECDGTYWVNWYSRVVVYFIIKYIQADVYDSFSVLNENVNINAKYEPHKIIGCFNTIKHTCEYALNSSLIYESPVKQNCFITKMFSHQTCAILAGMHHYMYIQLQGRNRHLISPIVKIIKSLIYNFKDKTTVFYINIVQNEFSVFHRDKYKASNI